MTYTPTIQPKTRKPIIWWKAGILAGIGFLLSAPLTIFVYYIIPYNWRKDILEWLIQIVAMLVFFAPALVATLSIAMFGSHKNHFYKTIGATIISLTIMLLLLALYYIFWVAGVYKGLSDDDVLIFTTIIYSVGIIASTFIWLVFGNLSKFRNQVQEG